MQITETSTMVEIRHDGGVLAIPHPAFNEAERVYLKNVRNSLLWAISCFAVLCVCEYAKLPHWTWMLNAIVGYLHLFAAMLGWLNSRRIVAKAFVKAFNDSMGETDAEI